MFSVEQKDFLVLLTKYLISIATEIDAPWVNSISNDFSRFLEEAEREPLFSESTSLFELGNFEHKGSENVISLCDERSVLNHLIAAQDEP